MPHRHCLVFFFTSRRTHWPLWRSYDVSQGAGGVPEPTGGVKQHYKEISAGSLDREELHLELPQRATYVSDTKNVEGDIVSPVPGGTSVFYM